MAMTPLISILGSAQVSSGAFGRKQRNQQTITCQVLAELNIN